MQQSTQSEGGHAAVVRLLLNKGADAARVLAPSNRNAADRGGATGPERAVSAAGRAADPPPSVHLLFLYGVHDPPLNVASRCKGKSN